MSEQPASAFDRTAFFVSDGTGITAETFGQSVLAQFDGLRIRRVRLPFVESVEQAEDVLLRVAAQARIDGRRPIVFSTLVDPEVNRVVRQADALFMDLFATFVEPLEQEFGMRSSHRVGQSHTVGNLEAYERRIDAINFALSHDDGQTAADLAKADVILVGVSRCGKTPTSLYLAMQHGIRAANCPMIPEDFERRRLPDMLYPHKHKIFGLSIAPERLHAVRNERRPNSRYSSLENCRYEVAEAESLMRRENIRWLSSTTKSIEEIATTILQEINAGDQDRVEKAGSGSGPRG